MNKDQCFSWSWDLSNVDRRLDDVQNYLLSERPVRAYQILQEAKERLSRARKYLKDIENPELLKLYADIHPDMACIRKPEGDDGTRA